MLRTLLIFSIATIMVMPLEAWSVQSCKKARTDERAAQERVRALTDQKSQLQEQVSGLYQELVLCQDIVLLSNNQREYCRTLKGESPKTVQKLINITTFLHHESKMLRGKQMQSQASCGLGSHRKTS